MTGRLTVVAIVLACSCVLPKLAYSQGCGAVGYNGYAPSIVIGTPSGNATPFTLSISGSNISLAWILDWDQTGIIFYEETADCDDPGGPYQETNNGGTIFPSFGGYGTIQVAGECQSGYNVVPNVYITARSTDLDADGDTDQDDKDNLRTAIATGSTNTAKYDFNGGGTVDTADYKYVQHEMRRAPEVQRTPCGGSVGDYEYDGVAPSAISDLSVQSTTCGSVTLQWTAPSDDNGYGACQLYQVRSANSGPINAFNMGSLVSGTVPSPAYPGTTQSFTPSLSACTQKYYAIITFDGQGNTTFSNTVSTSTPPCAINNLSASGGCTAITVTWTAPSCGSVYDLRISSSPITEQSPGTAVTSGVPSPGSGTQQATVEVGECTYRYFAIRTQNAYGVWSPMSNGTGVSTACVENCMDEGIPMEAAPTSMVLVAPSPNPATWSTELRFGVPPNHDRQPLDLAVFDPSGRRVRTLREGEATSGFHTVSWNLRTEGGGLAHPGVYLVRLVIGSERTTRTVAITR